ncbi:Sph1/Spa2 [Kluyveromyces lactis]|nr:Sph1/Spa2 [Kluyveromyces lactis]
MKEGAKELKYAQKVQIHNYYVALKQFFEITGGSHDRSMTSRAQKARSKLLKLSSSQFFELSTDVSDELQRRIDESQPQHDYLVPNESFHAKRNQARQKLANLSNARFNDLVDDILFEIRRRGFDTLPEPEEADYQEFPNADTGEDFNLNDKAEVSSPALHVLDSKPSPIVPSGINNKSVEELPEDENSALNATLQTSTVIPKTASIDWSSDEEDHKSEADENGFASEDNDIIKIDRASSLNQSPVIIPDETQSPPQPKTSSPVGNRSPISIDDHFTFSERPLSQSSEARTPLAQTAATTAMAASAGLSPLTNNKNKMGSLSQSVERNKDRDIELLVLEGNKLDSTITNLEREKSELLNQLDELKTNNQRLTEEVLQLKQNADQSSTTKALDSNFQKGMSEMTTQLNQLSIENEELKQEKLELQLQLKNVQSPVKSIDNKSEKDAAYWKSKYEDTFAENPVRTSSSSMAPISNKQLFPETSIIPSNLIDDLDSKLSQILSLIVSPEPPVLFLFENIASISEYCSKILTLVHSPDTKTMRLVLENTISHAITSVRYFSSYKTPLSRVILENSVSEISFAIYDLVKTVNGGSNNDEIFTSNKSGDQLDSPLGLSTQSRQTSNNFANGLHDGSVLDKPSLLPSRVDSVEMSPVKPLKITQKKSTDDASSRPVSVRKPSGTGLFTAMLNGGMKKDNASKKSKNILQLELPLDNNSKSDSNAPIIERRELKTIDAIKSASASNSLPPTSPLAKKSSAVVPSDFKDPNPFELSSPEKGKLLQNINSDIYNSNDEETESESIEEEDDGNSTYEVLRQTMKQKHLQEENGTNEEKKLKGIFSPVVHPQPIEVSTEDVDLNEKSFNFESEENARSESESVPSITVNKKDVKLVPIPAVTPTLKQKEPSPSPTAELVISPLRPIVTASDNSKVNDDQKTVDANERESETKEIAEQSETGETDDDIEFDVDAFDIENPDNSLSDLLLYLEYQTMDVINTIQSLLSSIKLPKSTAGELRTESNAINQVIRQMVEATSVSMNQSRNSQLKEHGSWVVQSLDDCRRRMTILCHLKPDGIVVAHEGDEELADKHFKQRLAGIAFDVAKCTKELVKTVEEASLKTNIEYLNAKLSK